MMNNSFEAPELARRATIEKGFVAFYGLQGKCLGRRDIDYIGNDVLHFFAGSSRLVGPWVQGLYLKLIWNPLKDSNL